MVAVIVLIMDHLGFKQFYKLDLSALQEKTFAKCQMARVLLPAVRSHSSNFFFPILTQHGNFTEAVIKLKLM